MPRKARLMSALELKEKATTPGEYSVGGVAGLYLVVRKSPTGALWTSWMLRRQGANSFKLGLGSYPDISLREARELAADALQKARAGADLVEEKRTAVAEHKARKRQKPKPTIATALPQYLAWKEERGDWKNAAETRRRVELRIRKHIIPNAGEILVETATPDDIAKLMQPIWIELHSTCNKIMPVLRGFFTWAATVAKIRPAEALNPADGRLLTPLLPAQKKRKKLVHFPFLEPDQVPGFMAALHAKGEDTVGARLAEFAILTCSRSANVRFARWDQIDMEKGVWTIDAEEMKITANGQHIVPLSRQAMKILERQRHEAQYLGGQYVFPGRTGRGWLSDAMAGNVVKHLHEKELKAGREGWIDRKRSEEEGRPIIAVPHAIARASFETWAQSLRKDARTISLCLHHTVDARLKSAYDRDASIELKRKLLQEWADFCLPED